MTESGERTRLRPHQRLRESADFQRVFQARRSYHAPELVLQCLPNGLAWSRLGVCVGKKHGNAVRRNRIKRVFRAAYRHAQHTLPAGFDYVLIPRQGVAEYTSAKVLATLIGMAPKIRAPRPTRRDPPAQSDSQSTVTPASSTQSQAGEGDGRVRVP